MKRRPPLPLSIDVCIPKDREIKELCKETNFEKDYEIISTLGRGSVGAVFHAYRKVDGKKVALKIVSSKLSDLVTLEYALLTSLDHPHIIKCYDYISLRSRDCEVLVFEYLDGGNLQQIVSKSRTIDEANACGIFWALLSALAYLHAKDIIHRDIKGDNVLVSEDLSDVRLIDFNTSRRIQEGESPLTMTGTLTWSAPEVLMGECPGKPNDVWGAGLCLHLMVFGKLPCSRKDLAIDTYIERLLKHIRHLQQLDDHAVSDECMNALRCCLEVDPTMRAQAQLLMQHSPFKDSSNCIGA